MSNTLRPDDNVAWIFKKSKNMSNTLLVCDRMILFDSIFLPD